MCTSMYTLQDSDQSIVQKPFWDLLTMPWHYVQHFKCNCLSLYLLNSQNQPKSILAFFSRNIYRKKRENLPRKVCKFGRTGAPPFYQLLQGYTPGGSICPSNRQHKLHNFCKVQQQQLLFRTRFLSTCSHCSQLKGRNKQEKPWTLNPKQIHEKPLICQQTKHIFINSWWIKGKGFDPGTKTDNKKNRIPCRIAIEFNWLDQWKLWTREDTSRQLLHWAPTWRDEMPPHALRKSPSSRSFISGADGEWSVLIMSISPACTATDPISGSSPVLDSSLILGQSFAGGQTSYICI